MVGTRVAKCNAAIVPFEFSNCPFDSYYVLARPARSRSTGTGMHFSLSSSRLRFSPIAEWGGSFELRGQSPGQRQRSTPNTPRPNR